MQIAFLACVVLASLFVWIERRQAAPLLDLSLFSQRAFVGTLLCTLGLLLCAQGLWWLSRHAATPVPMLWIPPLLLIGAGAALPWGLMDGLSVSVVPVQRAGMAVGMFGTVRVAGEGIALAAVTALLAWLIGRHLPLAWPEAKASAAMHLVTGALETTQAWLPHATVAELQQGQWPGAGPPVARALCADLCLRAAAAAAAAGAQRHVA